MTYKNIMVKVKIVWSWVLQVFQGVQFCFMHYLRMVQCIGDFLSAAFVQRDSNPVHQDIEDLELWNSFSYYPSVTTFDFLIGQRCKYLGKDKKFIHGEYLFTIDWAHPEPNILDTNILKYLINISVHIYWLLITVILQLSQIIGFFGLYLALQLQQLAGL
jgi:hypothetical protein